MAKRRRRRRTKKNLLDYIAIPRIDLDPDTKKSIFILSMLALGAISLLSLFGLAGSLGIFILKILTILFGYGKWIVPLIILALVYIMYHEDKYYIRGTNYLGVFLFLVSFQTLLHFFIKESSRLSAIDEGVGGGYIGMYLTKMFSGLLGFWGGLIILLCLLLGSLVLVFDTNLTKLIGSESIISKILYPFHAIFKRLFGRESEEDEDEEEEQEVDGDEEMDDEEDEEEEDYEGDLEEDVDDKIGFSKKAVSAIPEFMKKTEKKEAPTSWTPSNVKIDLPLDLLNGKSGKATGGDLKQSALVIQKTLENFNIPVEMGEVSVGPSVTQYTFKPADGIKLSKITTLSNDMALALAAHPIRIEAPIPGKALVGIEVPNQTKAVVGLKETMLGKIFKERKSPLMLALGKDVAGVSWSYDLCKMPHLLVAGATNSGKSVCLNSIIVSLLYQNNPDDLKFIMVDPKRVELPVYNGIPHLLTPVITDVGKTINALKWCLNEMDRRFETLSKAGKRNIQSYNEKAKPGEKMPYLVFIIDELADLMVAAAKDIEGSIIRLAQMARAVGIHLILATQRPSVDVITGLIKANMPARIAFSVASGTDSKTILDTLGAEKLLGQGDMLFLTAEISKPKRIQGAYVSDNEIKKVVNYIKEKGGEPSYVEGITDRQKVKGVAGVGLGDEDGGGDYDDLFEEAKEIVVNMGKASASLLQRRLSVGYARAARIMDELEEAGVIGPANGSKPRDILITKEQYAAMVATGTSGAALHSREESEAPENYLGEEAEGPTIFSSDDEESDEEAEDDYSEEESEAQEEFDSEEIEEDEEESDDEESDEEAEDGHHHSEEENEDEEEAVEDEKSEDIEEDEGMFFSK